MKSISRLLRAALPMMALALGAWASEPSNPTPCPDPWVCSPPPLLTDKHPQGDTIVCSGTTGSWSITANLQPGWKVRCDQREPVPASVEWSWKLTGPESASNSGSSFSYTPLACGEYTIVWTATIVADQPCGNSSDTATYHFNVPTPPIATTIENVEVCPGKEKLAHWTITNTSDECQYQYFYLAMYDGLGPSVSLSDSSGTVSVPPGDTREGDIKVKASQTTTRGDKNLDWFVISICEQSKYTPWTATVPKPQGTLSLPGGTICPNDELYVYWTFTNTGKCKETFLFNTALGVGDASLTLLEDPAISGTFDLEPNQSYSGSFGVIAAADSCGSRLVNVTVYSEGEEVDSDDSDVVIHDPNLLVSGDNLKLCPNERKAFGVIVRNQGECKESFAYTLLSEGEPTILFSGSLAGGGMVDPGGQPYVAPLTFARADLLTKAGVEKVYARVTDRCGTNDRLVSEITVPPSLAYVDLTGDPSCHPRPFELTIYIKNEGACRSQYNWALEQIAGNLLVSLSRASGTVTLQPQEERRIRIAVKFQQGSPNEGAADFKVTVTGPRLTETSDTVTITANPVQRIRVVGRSWINRPVYSRWDDFPADFLYPKPITSPPFFIPTYGTHNPQAYAAFLTGLEFLPDHGGTPARDGAYRLWSRVNLAGCCADGKIMNLQIQDKQHDGGTEFGLPGTHEFGAVTLERIDASTYKFQYELFGHPNLTAEVGIQLVRTRFSWDIWHIASGTISCGSDNTLRANLALYGSNFPTHELFVNGMPSGILPQGAITELWKPLPGLEPKVIGARP